MKKTLTLHVESMCRSDILGDTIVLPATPELEQAILVISNACSDEVKKREDYLVYELLDTKMRQIDYLQGDRHGLRMILRDIYDQGKKGVL